MTTLLVVDDDDAIVEVLCAILEDEGYEVLTARNGEEGLSRLATKRPAAILCDLMMPVLNGQEMCRRMQANPRYASIPFILMSAVGSSINPSTCRYSAILNKPFDLNEVLTIVARLVISSSC
jgi:two-component system, OmpR family, alkaline phosphatase synthesis response regulator PhoP